MLHVTYRDDGLVAFRRRWLEKCVEFADGRAVQKVGRSGRRGCVIFDHFQI